MKKLLLLGLLPLLGLGSAMQHTNPILTSGPKSRFVSGTAYSDRTAYCERAQALNAQIAEEGMVLLKNQDGALPLSSSKKKISVFGKSSVDLQLGGGGSGSGSVSSGITKVDLQKSLTDAGYQVNDTLTQFYKGSSSGGGRTNGNSGWTGVSEATVGESPLANYTDAVKASFSAYNDAAIMVLARGGTEGADCKTYDARDAKNDPLSKKHYLELSKNEGELLDLIEQHFDTVIVLINSGNAFQCDRLDSDDKVSAVIWMGTPGANGTEAIGKFLNGSVCPSGRTVDTWERDFTLNPTFQNFADNSQTNIDPSTGVEYPADTMFNADGSPTNSCSKATWSDQAHLVVKGGLNGVRPSAYVSYEEGVYMDYRYYETVYADMEAASKGSGDTWYSGNNGVVYPFGYGLSYTEFEQEIISCDKAGLTLNYRDQKMNFKVKVTNTGDVAGKDVVQLYWKAPYIEGGIEKPYETLCAFAKTKVLQPGESQEIKLDFYIQDQASYDFKDSNKNGFMGYELDPGDYKVSLNKNAHEVYDEVNFKVTNNGIKYKYDRVTGAEVKNRFSGQDFFSSIPLEDDIGFDQMSRENSFSVMASHPTIADRTLGADSRVEEFYTHEFTLADIDLTDDYEYMPEAAHKTKEDIQKLGWRQVPTGQTLSAADSTQFKEMVGVPLDDEKWDDFLNEFTYDELRRFVEGGGDHNPAISRIGKPSSSDSDGPSKFGAMWWCGAPIVAATYNVELAFEQGECVGIEGHMDNKYGWAGPGVNLHRSPFGGRNFEYYSADPFLTGRISGRVVAAASDKGIYCYFKHFAVNDQEKNREGVSCFVTEQALRELYLRPFQMCIEEGHSMGIMSSYNRLGLMETAASYPLLTEVLRGEWGFKGAIISDMTHRGNSAFNWRCYENINNRVLAGCNNQLDSSNYHDDVQATWDNTAFDGKGAPVFTHNGAKYESYSWWYAVRQMAKGAMYACANSGAMDREFVAKADGITFSGVEDGRFIATVGEDVNIDIEVSDDYSVGSEYDGKSIEDVEVVLDPVTTLPDGLEFDGSSIYGASEVVWNGFVHVLLNLELEGEEEPTVIGKSFEMTIVPDNPINPNVYEEPRKEETSEPEPEKKKGCFGTVEATAGIVLAFGAIGSTISYRKKKELKD